MLSTLYANVPSAESCKSCQSDCLRAPSLSTVSLSYGKLQITDEETPKNEASFSSSVGRHHCAVQCVNYNILSSALNKMPRSNSWQKGPGYIFNDCKDGTVRLHSLLHPLSPVNTDRVVLQDPSSAPRPCLHLQGRTSKAATADERCSPRQQKRVESQAMITQLLRD